MNIRLTAVMLGVVLVAGSLVGCDRDDDAPVAGAPDARLRAYVVEPSTPTPEGLAYLQALAEVHRAADGVEGPEQIRVLRQGLARPVPASLPEAEIARLELAARLAETLVEQPRGAKVARDLLAPMLATDRMLPVDQATARALVVLGDAAQKTGDDALAAGSYARAIRVLSLLRQELQP